MGANVQLRNISSASHFQSRSPAVALWISLRTFVKAKFSSQVTHIRVLRFTFLGPFLLLCASFRGLASTAMVVFCSQAARSSYCDQVLFCFSFARIADASPRKKK